MSLVLLTLLLILLLTDSVTVCITWTRRAHGQANFFATIFLCFHLALWHYVDVRTLDVAFIFPHRAINLFPHGAEITLGALVPPFPLRWIPSFSVLVTSRTSCSFFAFLDFRGHYCRLGVFFARPFFG